MGQEYGSNRTPNRVIRIQTERRTEVRLYDRTPLIIFYKVMQVDIVAPTDVRFRGWA